MKRFGPRPAGPARQTMPAHRSTTAQLAFKHAADWLVAAALLIALSPLFVIVAALVKMTSRGPAFFRQPRLGIRGEIFRVWKFRTMVDGAARTGSEMRTMASDPRITKVGRVLRRTRIDELPQVLNILAGEMSLIGPRPALPFQYDYYEEWEERRLDMRPGITGWSQTHGGNCLTWDERIVLDVWFVDHWSLWVDLQVLFSTFSELAGNLRGSRSTYRPGGIGWTRGVSEDPYVHHRGASSSRRQMGD